MSAQSWLRGRGLGNGATVRAPPPVTAILVFVVVASLIVLCQAQSTIFPTLETQPFDLGTGPIPFPSYPLAQTQFDQTNCGNTGYVAFHSGPEAPDAGQADSAASLPYVCLDAYDTLFVSYYAGPLHGKIRNPGWDSQVPGEEQPISNSVCGDLYTINSTLFRRYDANSARQGARCTHLYDD